MLALVAAAACEDSFPPVPGPMDHFYFPVGLAVRQLPPSLSYPAGRTALLVVSSNFDLRYDFDVGGTVLAVDPDDPSGNALNGDTHLAVLGGINIGSFGGQIAYLDDSCAPLAAADPLGVGAHGAKVVTTSRGRQEIYRIDMDPQGGLACDGCAVPTVHDALDPYGVTMVCDETDGVSHLGAWVTHLRAPGNLAWLTQVDLLTQPPALTSLPLGQVALGTAGMLYSQLGGSTFTTAYDGSGRLYVSTVMAAVGSAPLRWLDVRSTQPQNGLLIVSGTHDVGNDVTGALTRELAVSSDGQRGYLQTELYDYQYALSTGAVIETGGALAIYDLTSTPLGDPAMTLLRFVPTCLGVGEVRALPRPASATEPGLRDLVALTCDSDGTLLLYDDELEGVVARIALDPVTGQPVLGRQPSAIAVEERASGCLKFTGACTRLYVASFGQGWVNVLELDKWKPQGIVLAKRLGREQEQD